MKGHAFGFGADGENLRLLRLSGAGDFCDILAMSACIWRMELSEVSPSVVPHKHKLDSQSYPKFKLLDLSLY